MDSRRFVSEEIVTGLRILLLLRLEGTPAKDTITMVGKTWIIAFFRLKINWTEEKDRWRIREAFEKYSSQAKSTDRWPTPRQIIELLPPRIPPLMLNAPTRTPEQIAAMRKMIAENRKKLQPILEQLTAKMRMPQ